MRVLLWRSTSLSGVSSLLCVTYNTLSTLGYLECSVGFFLPPSHGETFGHLDHCRLYLRATFGVDVGLNPALKSLLWNIEMEQGQHQYHISSVESCLGFVSIDKTTFRTADPASDQLLTWMTVFLIAFASCKCRGEIHAFQHARL